MKRLIMCEGPNELEIMRILLRHDKLIFGEDDLIGLTPFHARQITGNAQVRTELNIYPGNDVLVMRIGDVQNEKLTIPENYRDKITGIEKYCTKPELEMLLIIAEGLTKGFEKTKSSTTPKNLQSSISALVIIAITTQLSFFGTILETDPKFLKALSRNTSASKKPTKKRNYTLPIC